MFADEVGRAINPRTDWDRWKRLLAAADVRDGRLHDARHTAATMLLVVGGFALVAAGQLVAVVPTVPARRPSGMGAPPTKTELTDLTHPSRVEAGLAA